MKTTGNIWKEREDVKNYLDQINRDGWLLKIQLILGAAFILFLTGYLLLFI